MEEQLQFAGEFKLDSVVITTHSNLKFDITNQVFEVNFFEELMSNSVSANLTIMDTQNIISDAPIIGQEYIEISIRTPNYRKKKTITYTDHVMVVRKISFNVDENQGKLYMMELVTPEFFKSNRVRVSQTYEGRYSDAIVKIFRDSTYLNSKKDFYVERTLENQKVIVPNMHPFAAIHMLSQRSVSEVYNDSSTYLFYETTKGYHFRTIESLINSPEWTEGTPGFTAGNPNDSDGEEVIDIEKSILRIQEYQILNSADMTTKIKGGLFASKLILHDAYNKNYQTYEYSYAEQFDSEEHLEKFPMFPSDGNADETSNKISDYYDSRLHVASTSSIEGVNAGKNFVSGTYPDHTNPYVDNNIDKWLLKRQSRLLQLLNGFQIRMVINGNTSLKVGDVIQVNIPTSGNGSDYEYDPYYTGKYIITKLRHFFSIKDEKHRIVMEVCKESLPKQIPNRLPVMKQGTGKTIEL